tara:strand:- start:457 stop:693 length:237 start_codon:yes stop_codon:yes gene_type:complete
MNCLITGLGISAISTGMYAVFTNKPEDKSNRKDEYITTFCIVFFVSLIIIYISSGNSKSLVVQGGGSTNPNLNNKPPF